MIQKCVQKSKLAADSKKQKFLMFILKKSSDARRSFDKFTSPTMPFLYNFFKTYNREKSAFCKLLQTP